MWWDPDELGEWALLKIINISRPYKSINKIKKYKKIILNIKDDLIRSKWCYKYCDKVEDDIEMMRGITHYLSTISIKKKHLIYLFLK